MKREAVIQCIMTSCDTVHYEEKLWYRREDQCIMKRGCDAVHYEELWCSALWREDVIQCIMKRGCDTVHVWRAHHTVLFMVNLLSEIDSGDIHLYTEQSLSSSLARWPLIIVYVCEQNNTHAKLLLLITDCDGSTIPEGHQGPIILNSILTAMKISAQFEICRVNNFTYESVMGGIDLLSWLKGSASQCNFWQQHPCTCACGYTVNELSQALLHIKVDCNYDSNNIHTCEHSPSFPYSSGHLPHQSPVLPVAPEITYTMAWYSFEIAITNTQRLWHSEWCSTYIYFTSHCHFQGFPTLRVGLNYSAY